MDFFKRILCVALTMALTFSHAAAQVATTADVEPPTSGGVLARMLPMFVLVFVVYYFMVLRPQERKLQKQQQLLKDLKRGDQIITDSGLIGRVAGIEKDHILVEVANNVKIKLISTHISGLYAQQQSSETKASAS